MSKTITLSTDKKYKEKFNELERIMKKPKSQIFRDMIDFFYNQKEHLSNGIHIKIVGED